VSRLLRALALPCLLAIVCRPSPARADQDELLLALEPGFGSIERGDVRSNGGGGGVSMSLGLTHAAWLTARASGYGFENGRPTLFEAVGGVTAALDVLRIVPFIEALAGIDTRQGRVDAVLSLGLGFDYLVSQHFSVGLVGHYRPLFGQGDESFLTVAARIAVRLEL
jgi:hypothetical protein